MAVVTAILVSAHACDAGDDGMPARNTVLSSALSIAPTDSPAAATTDASAADGLALGELLDEFVGDEHGGVAALVSRDGESTSAAAGVANIVGDPITPATPFRVGSISKPFVATMILQLVDEGRVELDEPLSSYLPDAPVGGDVTIRALLSHRSGLPNYTDRSDFIRDAVTELSRRFTPAEVLTYIETVPRQEPNQSFVYSNTNYILLGQVIEQVDRMDLNTALRERITLPLQLDATRFASGDDPTPLGLAAGWSAGILDGEPDDVYASIASSAWAAGALISTVGDLAQFLTSLFAGQLISDRALDEMTTTGSEGYGLGLFAVNFGPAQSGYGHDGMIFGYTASMAIDPATNDMIVIATNNEELQAGELAVRVLENW